MARFPRYHIDQPAKCAPVACCRCGGTGVYSQFHGTCWRCGGNGQDPVGTDWGFPAAWSDEECAAWWQAREERLAAQQAKAEAKRQAKEAAQWAANLERHPRLAEVEARWTELVADLDAAVVDIYWKGRKFDLSEKQVAWLLREVDGLDARKADAAARVAAKQAAGHLGAEGEKVAAEGTVVFVKGYDGQYGVRYLVIVEDTEGRTLKTWTTARWVHEVEKGSRVVLQGTVKAHEVREGKPETLLTRVKAEALDEAAGEVVAA